MADGKSLCFTIVAFLIACLLSVCEAGEYCSDWYGNTKYCSSGCCHDGDCCSGKVALIVGLCVGGAVLIFILILIFCLCRRRYYGGVVYRSGQSAMVVQQTTVSTQGGLVTTAGVQPGVVYPPYPGTYPQGVMAPAAPGYPGGPVPPPVYAAGPPAYKDVVPNEGGVNNPGFNSKN